jgi:hypothetical protein
VYVDKPYEKIVEVPYNVTRENVIWKENYVDVREEDLHRYQND